MHSSTRLCLALCLSLSMVTIAQSAMTQEEKDEILKTHNMYRKMVLNGEVPGQPKAKSMPEMVWNTALEAKAQYHADQCKFKHDTGADRKIPGYGWVGQNLAANTRDADPVVLWYNEYKDYEYSTGKCSKVCGHYTQVVWAKSTQLGCGKNYCKDLFNGRGGYIYTCNYAPGGNYNGEKPYVADTSAPEEQTSEDNTDPEEGKEQESEGEEEDDKQDPEEEDDDKQEPEQEPEEPEMSEEEKNKLLDSQNKYRAIIKDGIAPIYPAAVELPALEWDDELANAAKVYAKKCHFRTQPESERNTEHYKNYAQNSYFCPMLQSSATYTWWSFRYNYNYKENKNLRNSAILFKQMIYAKATKVGCYRKICGKYQTVFCNYDKRVDPQGRPYVEKKEEEKPVVEVNSEIGSELSSEQRDNLLKKHNSIRDWAMQGRIYRQPRAKQMPHFKWDPKLAAAAQKDVNACRWQAYPQTGQLEGVGSYTHNLLFYRGHIDPVMIWYRYRWSYNYVTNTGGWGAVKYKNLVNSKITKLGCAIKECKNMWGGIKVAKCNYAEMNYDDLKNNRPYEKA